MKVPEDLLRSVTRLDQNLPVGNEGSGVVEAAGEGAEHLIGKTVGVAGYNLALNIDAYQHQVVWK